MPSLPPRGIELDNRISTAEFTVPLYTPGPPPPWHEMVSLRATLFVHGRLASGQTFPICECRLSLCMSSPLLHSSSKPKVQPVSGIPRLLFSFSSHLSSSAPLTSYSTPTHIVRPSRQHDETFLTMAGTMRYHGKDNAHIDAGGRLRRRAAVLAAHQPLRSRGQVRQHLHAGLLHPVLQAARHYGRAGQTDEFRDQSQGAGVFCYDRCHGWGDGDDEA
jgi:hypothetical protein